MCFFSSLPFTLEVQSTKQSGWSVGWSMWRILYHQWAKFGRLGLPWVYPTNQPARPVFFTAVSYSLNCWGWDFYSGLYGECWGPGGPLDGFSRKEPSVFFLREKLGGETSNIFSCSPRSLGFHDPLWRSYFSNGLGLNHQLEKTRWTHQRNNNSGFNKKRRIPRGNRNLQTPENQADDRWRITMFDIGDTSTHSCLFLEPVMLICFGG